MRERLLGKRVLAIVPHQDDEVIGMGGSIAWACEVAESLDLVLVTDGASTLSALTVSGLSSCCRFVGIDPEREADLLAHDASLTEKENGELHHHPDLADRFKMEPDPERLGGRGSVSWGRQRDREFLSVAEQLGVSSSRIHLAYHDPSSPCAIKDGQIALGGRELSPEDRVARYAEVASHYFKRLSPDVVFTMAPYEFAPPPNDHWAMAHGAEQAARDCSIETVFYFHSGIHYQHVLKGGAHLGKRILLPENLWSVKKNGLREYLRWSPDEGWFATAPHSVYKTFCAIFSGEGRYEYVSDNPL
ncbi:MAG TPA: PIG-L family deacetylase [bacterium]|nr:PIG-L family deacetylase [bacterium]